MTDFKKAFDIALPRLVATYESGRLVPFIGSGMSLPACTTWWSFIRGLEVAIPNGNAGPIDEKTPRDELIRRANSAVRVLKAREPGAFERAVRAALASAPDPKIPAQTEALARLWWPLVLSTNYDNCYEAAFHAQFNGPASHQLAVVGRSIEDCQRVLNSLSVAGRTLLWALQGYLEAPHSTTFKKDSPEDLSRLREQLVVGHEEYRRVTYRDLHFRRAFAEVFRQRSLLFLGSGIQETYLQELFGEVLENYGPTTRPHYALIKRCEVDPEFMLARFQIVVIEYDEHRQVTDSLKQLADVAGRPNRAPVTWSWGRIEPEHDHWTSVADLEVVRGPLPTVRVEGECLAVSACGEAKSQFSPRIQSTVEKWGVAKSEEPEKLSSVYLGVFPNRNVYAVCAGFDADESRLSHIYDAALELFKCVGELYRGIHMELLATEESSNHARIYPERFSFVQIVRAWAAWREQHPKADCRLTLHVVLDSIYQDIASGRIDVLELLSCKDIRFFVEIVSSTGEIERRIFQKMPDYTLKRLVESLGLSDKLWTMEITPPQSFTPERPLPELLAFSLQELGIVPGSTLHFRRSLPSTAS